jgi:hypothetical protein
MIVFVTTLQYISHTGRYWVTENDDLRCIRDTLNTRSERNVLVSAQEGGHNKARPHQVNTITTRAVMSE